MSKDHHKYPDTTEDHSELDVILAQVVAQCSEGKKIDYEYLTKAHIEFMPELGRRLRNLQNLETVVQQFERYPQPELSSDSGENGDEGLLMLQKRLDGYDVLEPIFYGGQGVVYKARQRTTCRMVAIKVLVDGPLASERQRWRFAREIKLGARFQHPHIVTVYESGEVNGREFLAMEYIDGLPIDDYVLVHGLSVHQTVRLFQKVCGAVSYAHQNGVMHRDLKPANILVDDDSQPHVLDFGLAKDIDCEADASEPISIAGQVVGTLPYLSPEQARGDQDRVDVLSDVYALGVVLFHILTGEYPYEIVGSRRQVLENIIDRSPKKLRETLLEVEPSDEYAIAVINDDLEHIVCKALEKDKALRYQSAAAFAEDLERYLSGEAVDARATHQLYLLKKTLRRFRTHVIVGAIIISLLVSGLVGMTVLWQRAEHVAKIAQTGLQMASFLRLGTTHRDEGRTEQGMILFRKVIEIGEFADTTDPSVIRHLYDAHNRLAQVDLKRQDLDSADAHCASAFNLSKNLTLQDPQNLQWQRFLGLSYLLRGQIEIAKKQWAPALESLIQTKQIYAILQVEDPSNPSLISEMAYLLRLIANCHRKLHHMDIAFDHYVEAIDMYQNLSNLLPKVLDYQIEYHRSRGMLAIWHMVQHTNEDNAMAVQIFAVAKRSLQELADSTNRRNYIIDIEAILANIESNIDKLKARIDKQKTS